MRAGGSAADAAVATSAVLAVTTQHMCGAGGDLLALVHPGRSGGPVRALLAVGRAGSGSDADRLRAEGHARMPFRDDVRTVTVPGCVDGWLALHAAYGRLPLPQVLAAAIGYATEGFPASPLLAAAMPLIAGVRGGEDFHVPAVASTVIRRQRLADALTAIAAEGRDAWYGGAFGRGLLDVGDGMFHRGETSAATWPSGPSPHRCRSAAGRSCRRRPRRPATSSSPVPRSRIRSAPLRRRVRRRPAPARRGGTRHRPRPAGAARRRGAVGVAPRCRRPRASPRHWSARTEHSTCACRSRAAARSTSAPQTRTG